MPSAFEIAADLVAVCDARVRERCAMAGLDILDTRARIPMEPGLIMDLIGALAYHANQHRACTATAGASEDTDGR